MIVNSIYLKVISIGTDKPDISCVYGQWDSLSNPGVLGINIGVVVCKSPGKPVR
jgi:hypothetical protein